MVPVAAAAAAAPGLLKAVGSLFGGKKTVSALGELDGYIRLGQDNSPFSLSEPAEVLIVAPNGARATVSLPAGSYVAGSGAASPGYDLQKGASKAYFVRDPAGAGKTSRTTVAGEQRAPVTASAGAVPGQAAPAGVAQLVAFLLSPVGLLLAGVGVVLALRKDRR